MVCSLESANVFQIDFDTPNGGNSIRDAKFLESRKEIDVVNDQFQKALEQKHELMLQNESLSMELHKVEAR